MSLPNPDSARRQAAKVASPDSTVKSPDSPLHDPDLPGRLGRYRILGEIARGGMGRVMRIHDEAFDRPLAMKVLLERGDDRLADRFLREAKLTGQLQHPGIPPVQEMGKLENGRP